MKILGDWLNHSGTQALCRALTEAGHHALFVGGCVRNALLNVPVADIDIATDATPENVTNIAEKAGFRTIPTGMDHGTVTVLAHGVAHEVTTFRRDVQTDGRHATVAFTTNVAQDAARRDFTMNALYANALGEVIDPLRGLPDLLARRVRFVGDADARIREDHLRLLRFFRFHAVYGDPEGGIDADGLAACAAHSDQLGSLSRERIGWEMRKLLAAPDPALAVAAMAQIGALGAILPGSDPRALAPLVHLEADIAPRWQRRLAVVGGQDPAENLRLSRLESVTVQHIRDEIGTAKSPAALSWAYDVQTAADVVLCRAALLEQSLPPDWQADIARGAQASLPFSAADLMPHLQGPALGEALRDLTARWLASDLRLTKAQLLV